MSVLGPETGMTDRAAAPEADIAGSGSTARDPAPHGDVGLGTAASPEPVNGRACGPSAQPVAGSDSPRSGLAALVDRLRTREAEPAAPGAGLGYAWARTPLAAAARRLLQPLVIPLFKAAYGVDVNGWERVRGLHGPVIFVANHHHHLDGGLIVASMPASWRARLLVAAAADTIFTSPVRGALAALLGNAVPLERGGRGNSLDQLREMLTRGWSLLIFPEGRLTVGGPLRPFKGGTALLALETEAPVVPMWLSVRRPGAWEGRTGRGRMRLRIGQPLALPSTLDHAEAARLLEYAVKRLEPPAGNGRA
jgi:1-acyl-sn-glycerol-3-phosphate acyltransferase